MTQQVSQAYDSRIHGIYLTHWTGKDICKTVNCLTDENRIQYIQRIFSTLKTGLWLTAPEETLFGYADRSVKYEAPFISFTEVRAANVAQHAFRYGLLGFVFNREFVVKRGGGPVFYVGHDDWRVTNLDSLRTTIRQFSEVKKLVLDNKAASQEDLNKLKLLRNAADMLCCQMKSMHADSNDYLCYDECEWRLPHTDRAQDADFLTKANFPNPNKEPQYHLPFILQDLKFLIVPDAQTKDMLHKDGRFSENSFNGITKLNTLTLEEYGQI